MGYMRVSSKKQLDGNSLEQQFNEITERYPNIKVFEEQQSGVKDRPMFNKIFNSLEIGDTLVVTKLDRFCRSTKEGLGYIDDLLGRGVRIHILNMGLIENTAMGRLIVTCILAFAEFERSMILERTQSGKEIAKKKEGYKEGRPKKYSKEQIKNALNMLAVNGGTESYTSASRLLRISKSTLVRANREYHKNKLLNGEKLK